MGFIKRVLNGVFSFLVGIFGGLAKLVGLGKKSEYFLEADPIDQAVASSPASQSVMPAKASTANGQSVAPEAAIASSTALIATEKGANNGSATSTAKKSKVSKKALKADAEEAAKAEAAAAKASTPVATTAAAAPVNVTFAPNYLMTANSRSGRRRPGPSMNQFRDMARQVNSQN